MGTCYSTVTGLQMRCARRPPDIRQVANALQFGNFIARLERFGNFITKLERCRFFV
jgi:hypothetical protein